MIESRNQLMPPVPSPVPAGLPDGPIPSASASQRSANGWISAVRLEREGRVGFIVIDNPPINAGSLPVRAGLLAALDRLSADPSLEAGVLIGSGKSFIAGSDLREFSAPLADPQMPAVIAALENCPKPLVAAIHGAALGGGYEIALGCDGRVALADAVVGLPEGDFGLIPGAGGTVRLPRLTNAATALEIIASRRRVKAPEAQALGLVDDIVADLRGGAAAFALSLNGQKRRLRDRPAKPAEPQAFDKAAEAALRLGRNRPYAMEQVAALKRAIAKPFDEALAEERAVFQLLRQSAESAALRHLFFAEREAARAFAGVEALPLRSVGVVGAGTMGSGIAAAFLKAGIPVTLADRQSEILDAARGRIGGFLAKASAPAPLSLATDLAALSGCDLVLEAVFEDMAVKQELLRELDGLIRPDAILASNTSYLDLDAIAAATARPERVVGVHVFAPAHVMKLLEIVRGAKTAPQVVATALKLGRTLGKVAVVSGVGEGFIGNRIYNAYRTHCEAMLLAGTLPHEIDAAIEARGFAMGPFAVSDLSGLDIAWANRKRKQAETGDGSADLPVLQWLVENGRLGRKTGAGWYAYDATGKRVADEAVAKLIERARTERRIEARPLTAEQIQDRAMAAIVNEALLVLEDGIAQRPSDVDLVLVNGYGFPRHLGGPLHWAACQERDALERKLSAVARGGRVGDLARLA